MGKNLVFGVHWDFQWLYGFVVLYSGKGYTKKYNSLIIKYLP
jgi:hypothetical protein